MKKKIVSLSLALIMLVCAMLSFSPQAYAVDDPFVYMVPEDGPYLELFFDFTYDSNIQTIEFLPELPGYYIIQVYGGESLGPNQNAYVVDLTVRDYYQNSVVATGDDTSGYDGGCTVACWLSDTTYSIELWCSNLCSQARLSITYAEDFYPHTDDLEFEDIATYSVPGVLPTFTFNAYNKYQAQVLLISPDVSRDYDILVSGNFAGAAYLIDPSSPYPLNLIPAVPDHPGTMSLDASKLYYLVAFLNIGYGDDPTIEADEVYVTVLIR